MYITYQRMYIENRSDEIVPLTNQITIIWAAAEPHLVLCVCIFGDAAARLKNFRLAEQTEK